MYPAHQPRPPYDPQSKIIQFLREKKVTFPPDIKWGPPFKGNPRFVPVGWKCTFFLSLSRKFWIILDWEVVWRSRLVRWIHMGLVNTFGACCHHLLLKTTFVANWKKTPKKWHFWTLLDLGVPGGLKWGLGRDFVWNSLRCEFWWENSPHLSETPLLCILRVPKNGSHEQILTKNAKNRQKIDFFENRSGTAKVTYGVEIWRKLLFGA